MKYNNQQSVATLIYRGVQELIPGPLEKLIIHMVLMALTLMCKRQGRQVKVVGFFAPKVGLCLLVSWVCSSHAMKWTKIL
jgi:hypothetical protein